MQDKENIFSSHPVMAAESKVPVGGYTLAIKDTLLWLLSVLRWFNI